KEEAGEATNFAMAVRKRIEDSKVLDVYQHGSDRILILELGARDGKFRLLIEMFGKGNLILLSDAGKIEVCYKNVNYKDRTVRPGADYVLPKNESLDLSSLDNSNLRKVLESVAKADSKMIVEISKSINLGPMYLDEIIRSAGLNPKEALKEGEIGRLAEAFEKFFEELKNSQPTVYIKDGKPVDYSAMPLGKYSELEQKKVATISEALDEVCLESRHAVKTEGKNKELDELEANISKQKELVRQFSEDSANSAEAAKRIFANMNEVNSVIFYLQQNRRATLEEVIKEFPNLKIDKLNLKDKKVVLEI
ncbi:MAG: NFACT family protein, partial [Candidatus Micrarchaeota archaeon]|nr:NFACT family protein [Candidatus Micrarchaeota archaeon]